MQRNISSPKFPTLTTSNHGPKWATFMCSSPQVRKITKILKHTNIRIAFKCSNTILKLSRPANKTILPPPTPYDKCDIYMLTCMTCNSAYFGQTSRSLKLRYMEHTCYIKSNNLQSAYALHILNNQHEYSPIEKTMTLLKPLKNTSLLTPYEHVIIQSLHKAGRLNAEQSPSEPNPLLKLAIDSSHPPTLPHQSDNNFHTVHTACVPAPHDYGQQNQVCIQSITKTHPPTILTQPVLTPTHHLLTPPRNTQ